MNRVRVFCEPCFETHPTCPTTIRFPSAGVLFVPCPECGCQFRLNVKAGLWWELLLLKSSVLNELEFAREELDHVVTPADIGGLV